MGVEIERKFLLKNEAWRAVVSKKTAIKQGYLNSHKERTVRVRIYGNQGILTIKCKTQQMTRPEFEYEIPVTEALELIKLCEQPIIEKTRFEVAINGKTWEIDEFYGQNKGLIVAEIELSSETETVVMPDWIGAEVTQDIRYYNSSLIAHPFENWEK